MSAFMTAMEASIGSLSPKAKEPRPKLYLESLPNEILTMIFKNTSLPQTSRLALMTQNKRIHDLIAPILYHTPEFASSYRFGQFSLLMGSDSAWTPYFQHVRILDLSYLYPPPPPSLSSYDDTNDLSDAEDVDEDDFIEPQAGWRELQGIDAPLYHVYHEKRALPPYIHSTRPQMNPMCVSWKRMREMEQRGLLGGFLYSPLGSFWKSTHPPPSPELHSYRKVRDVPIGALVRVLAACRGLVKLDLSRLQLAKDCLVLNANESKDSISLASPLLPYLPSSSFPSPSPSPYPQTHQLDPAAATSAYLSSLVSPPTLTVTATLSPLTHNFMSDSPEPHRFLSDPLGPRWNEIAVYPDEIVYWLAQLKGLRTLSIRECMWFTTKRAWLLFCALEHCQIASPEPFLPPCGDGTKDDGKKRKGGEVLRIVDFTGSGLGVKIEKSRSGLDHASTAAWAVRGERARVERVLGEIVEGEGIEMEEKWRRGCMN